MLRGQFEGALYSRARFNTDERALACAHNYISAIVELDRKILIAEVVYLRKENNEEKIAS